MEGARAAAWGAEESPTSGRAGAGSRVDAAGRGRPVSAVGVARIETSDDRAGERASER